MEQCQIVGDPASVILVFWMYGYGFNWFLKIRQQHIVIVRSYVIVTTSHPEFFGNVLEIYAFSGKGYRITTCTCSSLLKPFSNPGQALFKLVLLPPIKLDYDLLGVESNYF